MLDHNKLKERFKGYEIDGDIVELLNVVSSNALVMTTLNDILSVLSKSKTNYIKIGYGSTLFEAYENGYTKGGSCKLIHIYFHEYRMNIMDLNRFLSGFEEDLIFGYTKDETINSGIKLVMIFS